jgi:hypothetical protein
MALNPIGDAPSYCWHEVCFVSGLVREEGIEPSTGAWKALALPLRHSRTRDGFYSPRVVSSSALWLRPHRDISTIYPQIPQIV